MNADLLEALLAVATACDFEARRCHHRLFVHEDHLSDCFSVSDEEHAVLLLTSCIDELLDHVDDLLAVRKRPGPELEDPPTYVHDDDIPF